MADLIHLLPDSVANQIAAGEVVQRPSSVVKELVENAVDAGATRIDVVAEDAGRTSIQVVDNGKGMSETDARLAFERHATSKIREAKDLFTLQTMGFRGEALPSVAAVAQVTLKTRAAGEDLGTCISIEGGKVLSQEVDACPVGCNFVVRNLFFNIPARRKFLKSNQTELSNIIQEVERVALVNPKVQFSFTHNGNLQFTLPVESQRQRIATMFGRKLGDQLLAVDVDTSLCRLTGFVGRPDSARKKSAHQYFFVNGRYMRHPYFQKAVQEAFEGLIQPTDQVPFFLYFEVDPANIDVNIHPTKTEIKFENELAIWQIVLAAVKESLGRFNAVPTIEFDTEGRPSDLPVYNDSRPVPQAAVSPSAGEHYNPFQTGKRSSPPAASSWESLYEAPSAAPSAVSPVDLAGWEAPVLPFEDVEPAGELDRSSVHYQYRGQYIVTEIRGGLMLIDQHRAHVRVLYNRFREQMSSGRGASQRLLFPELVQFATSDAALLEEVLDDLTSIGFDIASLGGGSFSVQGMPAGIDGLQPQHLLSDLIANLRAGGQSMEDELQHRLASTMAADAAIPRGQVLSQQEMESLLIDLFLTDTPNHTPDGHTIIVSLEHGHIEKMFR